MGWYIVIAVAIILIGIWISDAERNYVSRSCQDPSDDDLVERLHARFKEDK